MKLARPGIRTRVRRTAGSLADLRHRSALRRLRSGKPAAYREYLDGQLERTLSKRANDPGTGARLLVGKIATLGHLEPDSSVLCVGCRNPVELDLFKAAGVEDVVGIDLISQRHDILVMDMHDLDFEEDTFDAVYASHSLEHSFDVPTVIGEIDRVCRPGGIVGIEVPLGDGSSDADRVAFRTLDDLRAAVAPALEEELWAEDQPAMSPTNSQGTAIARIVFRVGAEQ